MHIQILFFHRICRCCSFYTCRLPQQHKSGQVNGADGRRRIHAGHSVADRNEPLVRARNRWSVPLAGQIDVKAFDESPTLTGYWGQGRLKR
ncbi:MAG: hypothetical protein OJF51_001073 [Nitrospira sp.]|jgi:hypothetical protein|nr:MAG: hypothetical protein OJF51_001073 [Nitrospira sp.]